MDIKTYAAQLLFFQSISIVFMFIVLKRQLDLFGTKIQPDLIWFRRGLFALVASITVCAVIFISINLFTILDIVTRSTQTINPIGVIYGYTITAVIFLFSVLVWLLYKMAAKIILISSKNVDKEIE